MMMMNRPEVLLVNTMTIRLATQPYEKYATVYVDPEITPKACLLYLHGGGLLYGDRNDLPDLHVETMTAAGYPIIAFDYPLAPATRIDDILADVADSINTYIQSPDQFRLPALPYVLWGRSAGAYLCLLAAAKCSLVTAPVGILSYYGYGFLCDGWFCEPAAYYRALPAVDASCLALLPQTPHAEGPLDTHYSAYVYARQSGNWISLLYEGREKYFYLNDTLRVCDSLPCPLFATHSTQDPDVPFAEFQELTRRYHADAYIVSGTTHDYDRDTDSPFTRELLERSLRFLGALRG